jgi:transposase
MTTLLTPEKTAELLGVSEQTLANWRCRSRRTGEPTLPYKKITGRVVRYSQEDVDRFLQKRTVGA